MKELTEEEYKKKISKISKERYHISNSELTGKRYELPLLEQKLEDYKKGYPSNILVYNKYMKECNNTRRAHPTQKPVDLLEYLVKTYTNEDEIVLDFTMGSGSCGVACINTNRRFIGIEINEQWFNIAQQRLNEPKQMEII